MAPFIFGRLSIYTIIRTQLEDIHRILDRDISYYVEDNSDVDVESVVSWSLDTIFKSARPVNELINMDFYCCR